MSKEIDKETSSWADGPQEKEEDSVWGAAAPVCTTDGCVEAWDSFEELISANEGTGVAPKAEETSGLSGWDRLMLSTVAELMENTAFVEAKRLTEPPDYSGKLKLVSLLVHEPVQGEFKLFMSTELLAWLADSVFGTVMEEIDEKVLNDFLGEMLNTLAGRFMAATLPPEETFMLGLPEPGEEEYQLNSDTDPTRAWHFSVEDMAFSITLVGESILSLPEEDAL